MGDFVLADDFDGYALAITKVSSVIHFGESATPQQLPELVFAKQGVFGYRGGHIVFDLRIILEIEQYY